MSYREAYAHGRISEAQLDRAIEVDLLRRAPTDHPLPEGWKPLPPCEHDWIDIITSFGNAYRTLLCAKCGAQEDE